MITVLLIIYLIMFILALTYIISCLVAKRVMTSRKKYQEHIDDLVDELFPPSTATASTHIVPIPTVNDADLQEHDLQYQETKRKMVADIRRYFNQRKVDAAIAKTPVRSYDDLTYPSPPSIQRMLE